MINKKLLTQSMEQFIEFVETTKFNSKEEFKKLMKQKFNCVEKGSIFIFDDFYVRVSYSKNKPYNLSNTILSITKLEKYDDKPLFVCVISKEGNNIVLGNSFFVEKASHSSVGIDFDNIKGSYNFSDIKKEIEGINNSSKNFDLLINYIYDYPFEKNINSIIEKTKSIKSTKKIKEFNQKEIDMILNAPERADKFLKSKNYIFLKEKLESFVNETKNEIFEIDTNLNSKESGAAHERIVFKRKETLKNDLGDYYENFGDEYITATDLKSKVIYHDDGSKKSSNPKFYSYNKLLDFLSNDKTIFMIFFLRVNKIEKIIETALLSVFDDSIFSQTIRQNVWSSKNGLGHTQLPGTVIDEVIKNKQPFKIDIDNVKKKLKELVDENNEKFKNELEKNKH